MAILAESFLSYTLFPKIGHGHFPKNIHKHPFWNAYYTPSAADKALWNEQRNKQQFTFPHM